MKENRSNKRIHWLDASRGLAFLMVIYSHLDYCNPDIMKFFAPVFLTTFFFVSGYLFKENQSFSYVLEQRTRTLFLPLLTLGGVMILLSRIISLKDPVSLEDALRGLILQSGDHVILWFIAALYIYSLGFYWVERFCTNEKALLWASLALFLLNEIYVYALDGPQLPWHASNIGFACCYMGMGKLYKSYESQIDRLISGKRLLLLLPVYIGLVAILNRYYSFAGSEYGVNAFLVTTIGLIVCVYISKLWINNNRLLLFAGANSLFYFAFHGKAYAVFEALVPKLFQAFNLQHTAAVDTCVGLAITLLVAVALIIPAMIVDRYLPWMLGKGFKLWKASKA